MQKGLNIRFLDEICKKISTLNEVDMHQKYTTFINTLIDMAYKDHLTKLHNRRYFEESLKKELCRFERYGYIFSICMIDINNFKYINDTYGHLKGDEILKNFAEILIASSRLSDIVCRWGGDEFSVILPHTTLSKIEPYLRKIISAFNIKLDNMSVSTSIGATSIRLNDTFESIIQRADELLYKAKNDKIPFYIS